MNKVKKYNKGFGGAAGGLIVLILANVFPDLPKEIAAAIATLIGFGAAALAPRNK